MRLISKILGVLTVVMVITVSGVTTTQAEEPISEFYQLYTNDDNIKKGSHFILGQTTSLYNEFESGRWGSVGTIALLKGTGVEVMQVKKGYMNYEDNGDKKHPKRVFLQIRDVVENKTYWILQAGHYGQQVVKQEAYISGYRLHFTYGYNTDIHTKKATQAYRNYTEYNNEVTFNGVTNKSNVAKNTNFYYEGIMYTDGDYYLKLSDGDYRVFYIVATDLAPGLAQADSVEEDIEDIVVEEPTIEEEEIFSPNVELQIGVTFYTTEPLEKVYRTRSTTRGLINQLSLPANTAYVYDKNMQTLGVDTVQIREVISGAKYYMYSTDIYNLKNISSFEDKTDIYGKVQDEKSKIKRNTTAYESMSAGGRFTDRVTLKKGTEVYIKDYVTNATGKTTYAVVTLGLSNKVYYLKADLLYKADIVTTITKTTKVTTPYLQFTKVYRGYKGVSVRNGVIQKTGNTRMDMDKTYKYMSDRVVKGVTFIRIKDNSTKLIYMVEKDDLAVILKETDQ